MLKGAVPGLGRPARRRPARGACRVGGCRRRPRVAAHPRNLRGRQGGGHRGGRRAGDQPAHRTRLRADLRCGRADRSSGSARLALDRSVVSGDRRGGRPARVGDPRVGGSRAAILVVRHQSNIRRILRRDETPPRPRLIGPGGLTAANSPDGHVIVTLESHAVCSQRRGIEVSDEQGTHGGHTGRRPRHPIPARHEGPAQGDAHGRRSPGDPVGGRGGRRVQASTTC